MRVDNDILVDARRTRTQKEPKRQSNKCSRKSKGKGKTQKKRTFSQETLSSKRISDELNPSNKSQTMKPHYLSGSPSSRLIRGPRPMTPTTKKMIQWIGGARAMSSANTNTTRTDPTTRTFPLIGISLSHFDCPLFIQHKGLE